MSIQGKRIALMIEDEYQILEGWYPYLRLIEAGAEVTVVGNGEKKTFESKEHYPMEPTPPRVRSPPTTSTAWSCRAASLRTTCGCTDR